MIIFTFIQISELKFKKWNLDVFIFKFYSENSTSRKLNFYRYDYFENIASSRQFFKKHFE